MKEQTPIDETLKERGGVYGDYKEQCEFVDNVMHMIDPNNRLPPVQRHSLYMIITKVSRIAGGDPWYEDNWTDIAGYARLVEREILKEKAAMQALQSEFPSAI